MLQFHNKNGYCEETNNIQILIGNNYKWVESKPQYYEKRAKLFKARGENVQNLGMCAKTNKVNPKV